MIIGFHRILLSLPTSFLQIPYQAPGRLCIDNRKVEQIPFHGSEGKSLLFSMGDCTILVLINHQSDWFLGFLFFSQYNGLILCVFVLLFSQFLQWLSTTALSLITDRTRLRSLDVDLYGT